MNYHEKKNNCFKNYRDDLSPLIKGRPVSFDLAIKEVKKLVKNSNGIHLDGLGCDLSGIDRIINFSEKNFASIDHMAGEEIAGFYSFFQREGGSISSIGEVRNRSDLVIFVNADEESIAPNFIEEIIKKKRLKNLNLKKKSINFISTKKKNETRYNYFTAQDLNEKLSWLKNNFLTEKNGTVHKEKNNFFKLLKLINESNYGVIIFKVDKNDHYLTKTVLDLIRTLNIKKKFSLFLYGGANNLAGFIQSSLWKTGFPHRYNFTCDGPIYNPLKYSSINQKSIKELQIFVSCFEEFPIINFFKKNIFIGNSKIKNKKIYDVFIPSSIPGVDQNGLIVRADQACVVKLKKIIDSNYKSVSEIFDLIN